MQSSVSFANDRRTETRWPAARARFGLWSPRLHVRPELVDFNSNGLAFRLPISASLSLGNTVSLMLQTERAIPVAELVTRVGYLARDGEKLRVGGPIECTRPVQRQSLWVPAAGDMAIVSVPDHQRQIVSAIKKHGPCATLRIDGRPDLEVRVCATPSDGVVDGLYLELPPYLDTANEVWAKLQLTILGACFCLDGALHRDSCGRVFLASPFDVRSMSRRRCDRATLSPDEALVRWRHPLNPAVVLTAPVRDLSAQGIGVVVPASVVPPTARSPVTLEFQGQSVDLDGELTYLVVEGANVRFGLRISALDPGDVIRVAHLCRSLRFPKLAPRSSASRDAVDALLRASGYLDLRSDMRAPSLWHVPVSNEFLSVDTVQRESDGTLIGQLSCLRVYGHTWMYHQLATIGQSQQSRECRRALYLDVVNWVATLGGNSGYSIAYFDPNKSWHQLLFAGFVDWAGSAALAVMVRLDRFDQKIERPVSAISEDFSIAALQANESAHATALVAKALPRLAIEAMDLTEALIARNLECAQRYARAGCERGRYPFALRKSGELVGLALCEVGSPRLSLFNLLNLAQIFVAPDAGDAGQDALVNHVRTFYAARGVANPIFVSPPGALTNPDRAGLVLTETMGAIAISAEGLKQYRNFLSFQLGRHARSGAQGGTAALPTRMMSNPGPRDFLAAQ